MTEKENTPKTMDNGVVDAENTQTGTEKEQKKQSAATSSPRHPFFDNLHRSFLFRLLFHNFKLKLLATLLALLTWFPFWSAWKQRCTVDLKLALIYDDGRIFIREQDKDVTIRLSLQNNDSNAQDDSWRQAESYQDHVRAIFPNSLSRAGRMSFSLADLEFRGFPGNVLPVSMEPKTVNIAYDTLETKIVPLEKPAEKVDGKMVYRVKSMEVDSVELRGPSRVLESIERLSLKDLTPPYQSPNVDLEVNNILRESGVHVIPTHVRVVIENETLDVQKEREYRLTVTPVMGKSAFQLVGKSPTVKVKVAGSVKDLEHISKDAILAYVLLEKATPDQNDTPKPVLIGGIPSGLTYQVTPPEVKLTLAAPPQPTPPKAPAPAAPAK